LAAASANASLITVGLGVSSNAGTATDATTSLSNVAQGAVVKVYLFAKTDTFGANPSNSVPTANSGGLGYVDFTGQTTDGGLRGFGFQVASTGTIGQINFNAGATATTFAISSADFAQIKPSRNDVEPDTDFDAKGGSFSDTANFTNVKLGTGASSTKLTSGAFSGYDLIATMLWTASPTALNNTNVPLALTLTAPTYYDSTSSSNWQQTYTQQSATGASVTIGTVPEPVSMGLLGLGSLLGLRRRKA